MALLHDACYLTQPLNPFVVRAGNHFARTSHAMRNELVEELIVEHRVGNLARIVRKNLNSAWYHVTLLEDHETIYRKVGNSNS